MDKLLNCSYLDDIGQRIVELAAEMKTASLMTNQLTTLGLNMKYKDVKLTAEQMDLYGSDIQKAKTNGLWDYSEEQRIISNYLECMELYAMVKQLSPTEQLTYFVEKNKKMLKEFDVEVDEAEVVKYATKMVANIRG